MSILIPKKTNQKALILSGFHSTFEESLAGLTAIEHHLRLKISSDPLSSQHVQVEKVEHGKVVDRLKIEKNAIELANQDHLALYRLLAYVLEHFTA